MNSPPCKNCQKRTLGCHAVCSDYSEWKQKKENELSKRKQELETVDTVVRGMLRKHKHVSH